MFYYNFPNPDLRRLLFEVLEEPVNVFKDALAFAQYHYRSKIIARHAVSRDKVEFIGEYFIFVSWWYQLNSEHEPAYPALRQGLQKRILDYEHIVCSVAERDIVVKSIEFYRALLNGALIETLGLLQLIKLCEFNVDMLKNIQKLSPVYNDDELAALDNLSAMFRVGDWALDELIDPPI